MFAVYLAVCDDKEEELESVLSLLDAWQAERGATLPRKGFRSASELLESVRQERFTLYLLDVMMPGLSGMECAREIRRLDAVASIVFLTVSPEFAYQSYGVKALDYLLKPVRAEALFPILDRLNLEEQRPQDGLTVKCGSTLVRVPFSQLAYLEVNRKHLYFNLADGQVRQVPGALNDYESLLLARPEFMRVHRSYIVNMHQVKELSPSGVRTFSGQSLPVSRLLYPQVQKDYMKLLFDRRVNL